MKNLSLLSLDTAMQTKMKDVRQEYKKKGFFSIEFAIIIVVALILLAAYLYKSSSLVGSANHTSAVRDMDTLRSAILIYQTQRKDGKLPENLDKLLVGVTSGEAIDGRDHEPLIDPGTRPNKANGKKTIRDPWGNEYKYERKSDGLSGSITCTEGDSSGKNGSSKVEF